MIAIWCEDRDNGNEGAVVFVLVRGVLDSQGEYRVGAMVFGEPLAEAE